MRASVSDHREPDAVDPLRYTVGHEEEDGMCNVCSASRWRFPGNAAAGALGVAATSARGGLGAALLGRETVAGVPAEVPNLGPRVSIVSAKSEMLTHLGTQPIGEGLGQFIAPHGIAVDSCGDIYVAEVSNTCWPILYGKNPDHELRTLQKLVKVN